MELVQERFQALREIDKVQKRQNEKIQNRKDKENDTDNNDNDNRKSPTQNYAQGSLDDVSKMVDECTDSIMDKFTALMDDVNSFIQNNGIDSM